MKEWIELIEQAIKLGVTKEEVREFIRLNSGTNQGVGTVQKR